MTYNVSGFDNVTGVMDLATGASTVSNGLVFGIVLLVIYVIIFVVFKNYDTKAVILGDAFICTIIAVLMWGAGWIGFNILIWPILAMFGSIIAYVFWPD